MPPPRYRVFATLFTRAYSSPRLAGMGSRVSAWIASVGTPGSQRSPRSRRVTSRREVRVADRERGGPRLSERPRIEADFARSFDDLPHELGRLDRGLSARPGADAVMR